MLGGLDRVFIINKVPLFAAIRRYSPLFAAICRYLPLFAAILRYLQLFAAICRYLPLYPLQHSPLFAAIRY